MGSKHTRQSNEKKYCLLTLYNWSTSQKNALY